jgi:hypothetical protein
VLKMRETSVMAEYSSEMQMVPRRFERLAPSRNPPSGRDVASESDNRRNGAGSWAFATLYRSDACHQLGDSAPCLKRDFKIDEVRHTSILAGVGVFVAVAKAGSACPTQPTVSASCRIASRPMTIVSAVLWGMSRIRSFANHWQLAAQNTASWSIKWWPRRRSCSDCIKLRPSWP